MRIIYLGVEPDALLEHIIGFYHSSPRLVYGAVFLISLSESLALFGLLVLQKNDVYLLAGGGGLIYGLKYNNP